MSSMVLRWSTSKIVFSDPDLGSKWPPSADIVFESILPKDHPCHVCFKLVDWFQKRRLLNNFPIGSYVKTMSADGSHFELKLCPVTLTSIQDGHLQQTYCSFNIGPYGKKCFKIFSDENSKKQRIFFI
jgi:hypothetical protein